MTTFAVTDPDHTIAAINYLLANLGTGSGSGNANTGNALIVNTTTGVIGIGGSTTVQSYYYRYVNIRYADTSTGGGFSTTPTNKSYYGVLNNNDPSPATLTNPASYQWFRVTGGFGTTKFLFYSTYGGRQVQFRADTSAPNTFFKQVGTTAIDLDFILSSQALPTIVLTAYQRSNTAPPTPTGGTYNFSTLAFTPPSGGWGNSVPTGNAPFYTTQNTFIAPVTGNTSGPSLSWTTPVITGQNGNNGSNGTSVFSYTVYQQSATTPVTPSGGTYNFATVTGTPPIGWLNTPVSTSNNSIFSSTAQAYSNTANGIWIGNTSSWSAPVQFTGAGGTPGTRGPVPMAYVITVADPTTSPGNQSSVLTAQWVASRTSLVPPIGTGLNPPVAGDTADFSWASNAAKSAVYTYNGTTWNSAVGQVINGNVFVTGSVNASALNANDVYALTLRGGAVTPGVYAGTGYWFEANTGNAYIAGNLKIGNNVSIGNNLSIGSGVTIGGLATNGNLNSNTVGTTQIQPGSVTTNSISANYVYAGNIISTGATLNSNTSPGYWLAYQSGDARFGGNVSIGNNLVVGNLITASSLNANVVTYNNIVSGTVPPPQGAGFYLPTTLNLSGAGSYDWNYVSGGAYGYYKSLSYITIPVTSSMAQVLNSSGIRYQIGFSCNISAANIIPSSSGPTFYLFTNVQQTGTTYGGSNQIYMIPSGASPVPSGGSNNPGSLSSNVPRVLNNANYNGAFSMGTTISLPYGGSGGVMVSGSTIVMGIGMFNSTNPATLGTLDFTNMSYNVILY